MGTKMAVAFANIFMSAVESKIIGKSKIKPIEWKRYIDDMFSLWNTNREEIDLTLLSSKARDLTKIQSLIAAHTSSRLRNFNTRISLPVTLQV